MGKTLHNWTNEEKEVIRREYNNGHNEELSRRCGVTLGMLTYQAGKLGLHKQVTRYPWTKDDDASLKRYAAKYNIPTIAKKMGRSMHSIYCRRRILRITYPNREWYTLGEARRIIGCGDTVIKRYISNGELKAIQHSGSKGYYWKVYRKDLRLFIRTYPEALSGRNVDIVTIVDILCGINYKEAA